MPQFSRRTERPRDRAERDGYDAEGFDWTGGHITVADTSYTDIQVVGTATEKTVEHVGVMVEDGNYADSIGIRFSIIDDSDSQRVAEITGNLANWDTAIGGLPVPDGYYAEVRLYNDTGVSIDALVTATSRYLDP